jgi:hypothetical protein
VPNDDGEEEDDDDDDDDGSPINFKVSSSTGSRNVKQICSLLTHFLEGILISFCAGLCETRLELFYCFWQFRDTHCVLDIPLQKIVCILEEGDIPYNLHPNSIYYEAVCPGTTSFRYGSAVGRHVIGISVLECPASAAIILLFIVTENFSSYFRFVIIRNRRIPLVLRPKLSLMLLSQHIIYLCWPANYFEILKSVCLLRSLMLSGL